MVSERLSGCVGQPGHADDGDARLRLPVPAQVVGHAHGPGGVSGHGVDTAVAGARAGAQHDERLGRQAVEPFTGGHGLVGVGIVPEAAPVALLLDGLVGDRPLDDQHERVELAPVRLEEPLQEVVGPADRAALEVDERPVDRDLREPRQGAEGDLLDARLGGCGQGDGVAVAAEPGVDPQDMDDGLVRRSFGDRQGAHPPLIVAPRMRGSPAVIQENPQPVNECLLHHGAFAYPGERRLTPRMGRARMKIPMEDGRPVGAEEGASRFELAPPRRFILPGDPAAALGAPGLRLRAGAPPRGVPFRPRRPAGGLPGPGAARDRRPRRGRLAEPRGRSGPTRVLGHRAGGAGPAGRGWA